MKSIRKIESYFDGRLSELRGLAERGDPWFFLCASAYIEYLMKIVIGKSGNQEDYKEFLRDYFFKACPEYSKFTFSCGSSDMDVQMYHVLRCGVVHSFSLIPDPKAIHKGGRYRSILLAHRAPGIRHLQPVVRARMKPKIDSVLFVAQDFIVDIEKVTRFVFGQARKRTTKGRDIRANMIAWTERYPPIGIKMLAI